MKKDALRVVHSIIRKRPTKTEVLRNMGIEPFLIKLGNEAITGNLNDFLEGVGTLVIAFPPGRRKNPDANYASRIKLLVESS